MSKLDEIRERITMLVALASEDGRTTDLLNIVKELADELERVDKALEHMGSVVSRKADFP